MRAGLFAIACLSLIPASVLAGEVDVVDVKIESTGDRTYRFNVTVVHADTGWEHYADRWDVLAPDGTVLGTRTLHHPHVEEQPFTRSTTLTIPAGIERVTVRAGDSVHDYGGATIEVDIPPQSPSTQE